MVRKPGHRNDLVPARQRQAEDLRDELGVVVEELVEIAHAKEQQHAGMLVLGILILLHDGSGHEWGGPLRSCFS